jgi:hypothetical protein
MHTLDCADNILDESHESLILFFNPFAELTLHLPQ